MFNVGDYVYVDCTRGNERVKCFAKITNVSNDDIYGDTYGIEPIRPDDLLSRDVSEIWLGTVQIYEIRPAEAELKERKAEIDRLLLYGFD